MGKRYVPGAMPNPESNAELPPQEVVAQAAGRELAADQPVPVTFKSAAFSRSELNAAMDVVIADNRGVVTVVGSEPDYSGISIALSSKAPPDAFDRIKAVSDIPVTLRGIVDPRPLGTTSDGAGNGS